MQSKRLIAAIGILAIIATAAILVTIVYPRLTETKQAAEINYTYNIRAEIISIKSAYFPWKEENAFKYIVVIKIPEGEEPNILSEAPHVLPELDVGYHSVSIPDADLAGYVDWINSSQDFVDSEGVRIRQYVLEQWAQEELITLSCHEELGSTGHAELQCSEF
jgi:hypothetical protein